jgi:hypothetical protein
MPNEMLEDSLAAVTEAWRRTRDGRAGDLAQALAALAHPPRKLGKTIGEQHEAWLALEATHTEADVPTLLASIAVGRAELAAERFERMTGWEPSPLVGRALCALFEAPPYPAQHTLPMWEQILALLTRHVDRSVEERLAQVGGRPWPGSARMSKLVREAIKKTLEGRAQAPTWPALSGDEAKAIDAIERRFAPAAPPGGSTAVRDEDLFGAVLEHPEETERLEILRDRLLEKGDPRGELIALQLAPSLDAKGQRRVAGLLRKHQKTWLGTLAPVARDSTFERGFVATIVYSARYAAQLKALVGDPVWATVRAVDFFEPRSREAIVRLLVHPVMRSLREVRRLHTDEVGALGRHARAKDLETIGFVAHDALRPPPDFDLDPFTKLRGIEVRSRLYRPPPIAWLMAHPVLPRLERLRIANGDEAFPAWLEAVQARGDRLAELVVEPTEDPASGLLVHTLRRGPSGALDQLVLELRHPGLRYSVEASKYFSEAIMRLPQRSIGRLEVVLPNVMASSEPILQNCANGRAREVVITPT